MKILSNLDLTNNQLMNIRLQQLAACPSTPGEGLIYWNTVTHSVHVYDGTSEIDLGPMNGQGLIDTINNGAGTGTIDLVRLNMNVQNSVAASHTHTNQAILQAIEVAFTTALKTKLDGIAAGAQVNAVTSVAGKTGAVSLAKADVGLTNVTNDAQVKKLATSTSGKIPSWNGTTGDALNDGYTVETTLTGGTAALPRADAVKSYVDNLISANDAMVFKGTIGAGGTITALPTTHQAGWTYRVITAATYAGVVCEVGDLMVTVIDRAGTGNLNTDWTVVQTNTDGAVIGPASATNGNFPIFNGTTGKLIANSIYSPGSFATASHTHGSFNRATSALGGASVFSDIVVVDGIVTAISTRTLYASDISATKKYSVAIGGATAIQVTHNLNTMDAVVSIREVASPYCQVEADIEFTSVNVITVYFAVAPAAGAYRVTVIG